jgi:site-specific recombinase XerD
LTESNYFATVKPPRVSVQQVQPFTDDQLAALLDAARKSASSKRNVAIVLLLLETGMRASEVCGLTRGDVDLQERCCTVLGKGRKTRRVYSGSMAGRALMEYLRKLPREPHESLFTSDRGSRAGEAMTRLTLLQIIMKLGRQSNVSMRTRIGCATFAVSFLRAGGNVFTLKELLGRAEPPLPTT